MSGFASLTPALQVQIVNVLGWTGLRPVQEATIDAVLGGRHAVVLAPTAGGKTEAALFPLLSRAVEEDWAPVSILYVAPIRALLNNQEKRLEKLAGLVGRRAAKWHGDVNASARRRVVREPPDVLAITPESLEALLVSTRLPGKRVLGNVRAVVIDEVHAFAADDRGAHLMALLERIGRIARRPVQRVGLSATVGDPEAIAAWLEGATGIEAVVVDPGGARREPDLRLDWVGALENAATVIDRGFPGTRRLVFADSRRTVEALGRALTARGVDAYVSHSSLSVAERQSAERAFESGENCVIVATSALELGIDVGDLDHVLQVDAPGSVSSFLQRMGRTGRRPGTRANCTYLCTKPDQLLQAAALLRLHARGYVEPTAPSTAAPHVLAHQLMALALQEGGVPVADWWAWVEGASPFAGVGDEVREAVVRHMLGDEILVETSGRYVLGPAGERRYGARNFLELYAVFSTPPVLRVFHGATEVGTVDAWFAQQEEELSFVLGGRAWKVLSVNWGRGTCQVVPSDAARLPRWLGSPLALRRELCEALRDLLVDDAHDPWWTNRARQEIDAQREAHTWLRDEPRPLVSDGNRVRWMTFAGARANQVLAALLDELLGERISVSNSAVTFSEEAAKSDVAIRQAIRELAGREITVDLLRPLVTDRARQRLSKFQPCLPDDVERDWLVERVFDLEGARAVLSEAVGSL